MRREEKGKGEERKKSRKAWAAETPRANGSKRPAPGPFFGADSGGGAAERRPPKADRRGSNRQAFFLPVIKAQSSKRRHSTPSNHCE